MPSEVSRIVSEGMKRVCSDMHEYFKQRGFRKSGGRKWVRNRNDRIDYIYFLGPTYLTSQNSLDTYG